MRVPTLCSLAAACAATLLGGCAGEDQFVTHVAPELRGAPPAPIAVFGVFRDGRMTTKGWEDISVRFDALGPEPCGALYNLDLVASDGALASAIDGYSKNYGVNDTLLGAFGAASRADLILAVVVSGALPKHQASEDTPAPAPNPMYRGRRTSLAARARPERGALEIAAELFSVRRKETVAVVSMRYTGRSEEEAIDRMNAKLKALFPGAGCEGWDLAGHPVDAEMVRGLREE